MNKHIYILLFFVCFGFSKLYSAYDPQFSQFYAAPLYMGPSFAGATENTRFVLNYRDQWPKLNNVYVTYAFSADHYIPEYNSGIGLLVLRDQLGGGKLYTTSIVGQYAYNIKLGNIWHLRPGLQFLYLQKGYDYSLIYFSDQMSLDGRNPTSIEIPTDDKISHYDFGTSALFHTKSMWYGLTLDHLMKTNTALKDNFDYSPIKISVYGGGKIPLESSFYKRDKHSMFVAFNFKWQGPDQQLDIGTYYEKQGMNVGLWYRGIPVFSSISHDALTLMFGYKINSIAIGYSYDITISKLIMQTGGAHEISLTYLLNQNPWNRRKKITPLPCPIF